MSSNANSVCGVALIRADGATLLQLRDDKPDIADPGLWVLPGGHIEPGETLEAGARREFLEETRYLCENLHLFITCPGDDLGYEPDLQFSFFWERFDEIQQISCCEGQQVRFVHRSEAHNLPMPAYLPAIWDLALKASFSL